MVKSLRYCKSRMKNGRNRKESLSVGRLRIAPSGIVSTGFYDVKEILETAYSFDVSITIFLTAVMASSVIEMETNRRRPEDYEPIQIMVPVTRSEEGGGGYKTVN